MIRTCIDKFYAYMQTTVVGIDVRDDLYICIALYVIYVIFS